MYILHRGGFLQLDGSMVTVNQVGGDMGQSGVILANADECLTQKDGAIPQFTSLSIVNGQVGVSMMSLLPCILVSLQCSCLIV